MQAAPWRGRPVAGCEVWFEAVGAPSRPLPWWPLGMARRRAPRGLDAQDFKGFTALHLARDFSDASTTALLLSRGADVGAADDKGWCALHWAAQDGECATACGSCGRAGGSCGRSRRRCGRARRSCGRAGGSCGRTWRCLRGTGRRCGRAGGGCGRALGARGGAGGARRARGQAPAARLSGQAVAGAACLACCAACCGVISDGHVLGRQCPSFPGWRRPLRRLSCRPRQCTQPVDWRHRACHCDTGHVTAVSSLGRLLRAHAHIPATRCKHNTCPRSGQAHLKRQLAARRAPPPPAASRGPAWPSNRTSTPCATSC